MSITKEEAIEIVYDVLDIIPESFCWIGDVYAHFALSIADPTKTQFIGYGIINDITWDTESNIAKKRIWIHSTTLATFPPMPLPPLNMQIHHIVQGFYEDVDHTKKIYIIPLDNDRILEILKREKEKLDPEIKQETTPQPSNIYQFRPKGEKR